MGLNNHSAFLVVTHDHRMVEGFDRIFQVSDGRIIDEKNNAATGGTDGLG
jgi:putative ABC transport system ATP-binding protein